MIVKFNSLDRTEKPIFTLCNPGSTYTDGRLTNIVGILPNHEAEECVFNFNETSELNFRIYNTPLEDETADEYSKAMYDAVKNKRLIFMEDIGYFIIDDVNEQYDNDGKEYKDVSAKSIDAELQQRNIPYIADGTYRFSTHGTTKGIFETIMETIPLWTIGEVDSTIAEKYRTFEDVDTSLNCLGFMIENLQEAYECIILFDTINRVVNVYDQANYVHLTSVHLTKNDVINSLKITEHSDDLYTAITVSGEDDVLIADVNPLGTNTIYNFDYYLDWMTSGLKTKVVAWQAAINSAKSNYYQLNLSRYNLRKSASDLTNDIDKLNIQIKIYNSCRDNIVGDQSTNIVESGNAELQKYGGTPITITGEIDDVVDEIEGLIADCETEKSSKQAQLTTVSGQIEAIESQLTTIINNLSFASNFTTSELEELANYIFEGTYKDEYVVITDIMDYSEKFEQMKTLYDRAESQLEKVSIPTQEFDIDTENILFQKEFEHAGVQLETGCLINVEVKDGDVAELFLSCIKVNYDDYSLSMTFGNRYNKFDPKTLFNSVLGSVSKSANTLGFIKDTIYPIKQGALNLMATEIQNARDLTMAGALASDSEEVVIDSTGYTGRRKNQNTGEFDPEQIKITNNNIVFTDDSWDTSKLAIGRIVLGENTSIYGVNAEALIGNIIIGNELHIKDSQGQDIMTVIDGRISTEVTEVKSAAASGTYEYYDPNDSSWSEKNNVDFFGYGISQDQTETDTGVKAADNPNKYFLDKHIGNLYKSNGTKWVFQKTLSPKFNNYSTITYTDGKASAAESNAKTYAEGQASTAESNAKTYADGKATDAYNNALGYVSTYYITSEDAGTAINQTKQEIEMTAAKAVSKYEIPDGITINFAGYGDPTTQGAVATAANQYYLDQETGNLYKSNSSKQWGSTPTQTLTLITNNLDSKIDQTAESITQTVSATYSTKQETATAKSEAISAASDDATAKANTAKSEAISAASTDATNKANAARDAAIADTDNKLLSYSTTTQMNTKIDETAGHIISEANARLEATVGYSTKNVLEITLDSKTVSGITYTVDKAAGTITVNGTATKQSQFSVPISPDLSGNFYFSGCPAGGSGSKYDLYAWDKTTGVRVKKWDGVTNCVSDYGETSQEIKLIQGHESQLTIRVQNGVTVSNLVFGLMIRDGSFADDSTFEPYRSVQTQFSEANSKIVQTAHGITQTVAAANAVEYIIPSGVTVNYHGYGFGQTSGGTIDYTMTDTGISAVGNSGKKFLNQSNGILYTSNGTTWENTQQQLATKFSEYKTASQTTSEINQTADSVTLSVLSTTAGAMGKYDETGVTINFYGYGVPTTVSGSSQGSVYLDQETGYVYTRGSGETSWTKTSELTLYTEKLGSQITQTASEISLAAYATVGQGVPVAFNPIMESKTVNGITFTKQLDGSYLINGTNEASGGARVYISTIDGVEHTSTSDNAIKTNGTYVIKATGDDDIAVGMYIYTQGDIPAYGSHDAVVEITNAATGRNAVWIGVNAGTYNNVRIYPVIYLQSDEDKTLESNLCSIISARPEAITLSTTGRLIITSGNFQVDASGNVTATNATLTGGAIQTANYTPATQNTKTVGGKINLSATGSALLFDTANFKITGGGTVTAEGVTLNSCSIRNGDVQISSNSEAQKDSFMKLQSEFVADNKCYNYTMNVSPYQITHQYTKYSGATSSTSVSVRDVIYIGNNGNITLMNSEGMSGRPKVTIGTGSISVEDTTTYDKAHTEIYTTGICSYDSISSTSKYTQIQGSSLWTENLYATTAYVNTLDRSSGNIAVRTNLAFASGFGINLAGKMALQVYNNEIAVGADSLPLRVYATNAYVPSAWIVSSDERKKQNIESLDNRYLDVVKSIEPKRFKYIDIEKDRYHSGYTAQDVKAAMDKVGIAIDEMSAFVDAKGDGSDLALRYEEFIPMLHKWLQELDSRLSALEKKGEE